MLDLLRWVVRITSHDVVDVPYWWRIIVYSQLMALLSEAWRHDEIKTAAPPLSGRYGQCASGTPGSGLH